MVNIDLNSPPLFNASTFEVEPSAENLDSTDINLPFPSTLIPASSDEAETSQANLQIINFNYLKPLPHIPINASADEVEYSAGNLQFINLNLSSPPTNSPTNKFASFSHHNHIMWKCSSCPAFCLPGFAVYDNSTNNLCLPLFPSRSDTGTPPPAVSHIAPVMSAKTVIPRVRSFLDAVVKLFCVHIKRNPLVPWQVRQYNSAGSGVLIRGRKVVTNAHNVVCCTRVLLRRRDSHIKYKANVVAFDAQCDSALLTVDDDEFWEGVDPVEFGDLPALQDAVTVVGYPIGGDTISVTSGVVSRIEILSYVHGSTELLGLQIDAAINSGNSGGPAFNDKGICVGIAFQSLKHDDAENIGYVIPTPVIMHFIQDYEKNGSYTGFPILGVEWQKMENPDLRLSMGMKPDQKGVRIRRIDPTAPEFNVLKPSDIILSFDGVDIANDGTVPFRHGERIGFSYLVSQKYSGDNAVIEVLRNSKILKFNVKLGTHRRLVPAHNKGKPPSYYIIAGFVFSTVSVPYLRSEYGKEYEYEAPVKLLDKLLHDMPQSPEEQIVVVSQVLVADINIGYEDIVNTQVHAFNGRPVKNLKSLALMVESCNDEYLKFDLEYQQVVVLQTKNAKAATSDILTTHCIPSAMSDDLKA